MAISTRKRAANPIIAFRRARWAIAALAVTCGVLAAGCGSDEPFAAISIAIRTDGGSPALSVFAGDLWDHPIELPQGTYYIKAINKDGDVFPFNEVEVAPGEKVAVAPFSGSRPDPQLAGAVRTTANFLIDLELARMTAMSGVSGSFQTPLFDPEAEASPAHVEALFDGIRSLGDQEDAFMAALYTIDEEAQAAHRVDYVQARAPNRDALVNDIIDMMPQFFKDIASGPERERKRVLNIAKEMSELEKEEAFGGMPANLRGDAGSLDDWLRQVRGGKFDGQIDAIHGYLYVSAGEATQRSGHTLGRTVAEEGVPLVNSGTDLVVKTYGKVPGLGKAIELTEKAKEWDAYLQKVYADPLGTLEASARQTAEAALADKIKKDLARLAPELSESTLDSLSEQLAMGVVAAIPGLKTSPAASAPPAVSDEEWIEEIVQTVAEKLLADGERGIEVAVATDDLRQCLKEVLAGATSRLEALSLCESLENSATTWIDEAVYYAELQFEGAGMAPDDALDQALAYGNCLRSRWWDGGATREEALAECEGFLDISPPPAEPTAAPAPVATPAPTPCNADPDGDGITDLASIVECQGTPTPVKTPCADFDPLCGLSQ